MTRLFNRQSLLSLLLLAVTNFCAMSSFAATLKVSDNLIVSEIDNKTIDHGFLDNTSQFKLASGSHALILRYKDVFEDLDFAEERVVESNEFVVKFTIANEQQLTLTTPAINNLRSAQTFSKSPQLQLTDEREQSLGLVFEKVADYRLAKQVDIVVNTLALKQTAEKSVAPVVRTSKQTANTQLQPQSKLKQVNALIMLKYWWKNASDEDKEHFTKYINKDN